MRLLLLLLLCLPALAQTGRISGVIRDEVTKEPLPFAPVIILQDGVFQTVTTTDEKGAFKTAPLTPGRYDLEATFVGYTPLKMNGIVVSADQSTVLNRLRMSESTDTQEVVVVEYKVPVIHKAPRVTGRQLTAEDLTIIRSRGCFFIDCAVNLVPGVYSKLEQSPDPAPKRKKTMPHFGRTYTSEEISRFPGRHLNALTATTPGVW